MNQLESIASSLSEGTEEQIKNNILLHRINSSLRSNLDFIVGQRDELVDQLDRMTFKRDEACAELARKSAECNELLAALKLAEQWLQGWASADEELAVIRAAIAKAVQP